MAEGHDAAVVSLPRDALFEILSRIPVKSVCRFRCVSKEWQSLLSYPAFISQLEPLLVTSYCGKKPYTDSSIQVMDMEGNVVREIKGLGPSPFLASSLDNLICIISPGQVTRVVDVATGKVLVASPKPAVHLRNFFIRLGRAAVSSSCKAVRIVEFCRAYGVQPPLTCEVLTLGGDDAKWRPAQPPLDSIRLLDFREDWAGAMVNGVVHFLSRWRSLVRDTVLCFDIESEEWRKTIDGPFKTDDSELDTNPLRIAEFDKSLCMFQTTVDRTCTIWRLIDPCNSIWVKAYSIPMRFSYQSVFPVTVMPDGVNLLFYYVLPSVLAFEEPLVLRLYDYRSRTCTTAMNMPKYTFNRISFCSLHLERLICGATKT